MVNIGFFDTHASQVNTGATETGTHANLLMKVSDAIRVCMSDLKTLGVSKRIGGMTFSEFGRRIKSNAVMELIMEQQHPSLFLAMPYKVVY